MAKELIMPKFGFTQETAEVVEWLVAEGTAVEAGDPLLEVTTDKVNMEVEAPVDGILAGVRVQPGDVVPVTEIIAYILEPGEALPPEATSLAQKSPVVAEASTTSIGPGRAGGDLGGMATPVAARMAADLGVDLAMVQGSGSGGRITRQDVENYIDAGRPVNGRGQPAPVGGKVRATPAARRAAREQGINLAGVSGSGPAGRIQEQDVLDFRSAQPAAPTGRPPTADVPAAPPHVVLPMSRMRQAIGRNLQYSWQTAPHITFQSTVDMTAVERLLENANWRLPEGMEKLTLTAAVTRAAAWALGQHPYLNSWLVDGEIWQISEVNIGMAVALDDGLVVPVIRQADRKGIGQISREIRDAARRARAGELRPADLSDGSFSISNLGMFGIDQFTAIINPPQVAILAVGRTMKAFVPDEADRPQVVSQCTMTLSADHRVVDGAAAAMFMRDFSLALEAPETMLL